MDIMEVLTLLVTYQPMACTLTTQLLKLYHLGTTSCKQWLMKMQYTLGTLTTHMKLKIML